MLAKSMNLGAHRTATVTVKLSAGSYTIFCGLHLTMMHTSFRAT